MADQKLTQLTALTALTDDDLFYVVDDPAGVPVGEKVTWADMVTALTTTAKARVYRSAAYTPGASGAVKVPLDAENYDPGNNFDLVNSRFIAPFAGYYAVSGASSIKGATAGDTLITMLYVNGAEYSRGNRVIIGTTGVHALVISDIVHMAAGSYVELWVYCSTARAFEVGSGVTHLSVHLLSTN